MMQIEKPKVVIEEKNDGSYAAKWSLMLGGMA